ncbi:MAG: redox-sensing transcriptional repressor Rex, partial [Planctomycetia bacterium]
PKATVARLSLYLRQLEVLERRDETTVSSQRLGSAVNVTDAQVRKDLAFFGQFGYPGIGYKVVELRESLREVLGTNRTWRLALVGIGNLGRALLGYSGFAGRGFEIVALFDRDPSVVGQMIYGLTVYDMADVQTVAPRLGVQMAVLAVPGPSAESVAHQLSCAGIEGILNFAPIPLTLPSKVSVVSVDLGLQLEQLAFQIRQRPTPNDDLP